MKKNVKSVENNAKIIVDFQLNVTKLKDGQTVVNDHADGKFTVEIHEVRETLRAAVASVLKGAADSFEDDKPDEYYD